MAERVGKTDQKLPGSPRKLNNILQECRIMSAKKTKDIN